MTSLWRKRKTSDKVATDVHHNEQKQDTLRFKYPIKGFKYQVERTHDTRRRVKTMREVFL